VNVLLTPSLAGMAKCDHQLLSRPQKKTSFLKDCFTSLTSRVILALSVNLSTIFTRDFSVCATGLREITFKLYLSLVQHASNTLLDFSQALCKNVISKNRLAVVFVLHVQIYKP